MLPRRRAKNKYISISKCSERMRVINDLEPKLVAAPSNRDAQVIEIHSTARVAANRNRFTFRCEESAFYDHWSGIRSCSIYDLSPATGRYIYQKRREVMWLWWNWILCCCRNCFDKSMQIYRGNFLRTTHLYRANTQRVAATLLNTAWRIRLSPRG